MRMPITRYGLREVLCILAVTIAAALLSWWLWPSARGAAQLVAGIIFVLGAAFFRDPQRHIPTEADILLAPADGTVTEIEQLSEIEFLDGQATRIGIFLSVLDVHINRSPCSGEVAYIKEHPGKCLNAMRHQAASQQNQANSLGLDCPEHPAKKVLVKQITGAIARRIVCVCRPGDRLDSGEKFGMIKFGSRTELAFPTNQRAEVLVKPGDSVRAGETIMVRYGQSPVETQP